MWYSKRSCLSFSTCYLISPTHHPAGNSGTEEFASPRKWDFNGMSQQHVRSLCNVHSMYCVRTVHRVSCAFYFSITFVPLLKLYYYIIFSNCYGLLSLSLSLHFPAERGRDGCRNIFGGSGVPRRGVEVFKPAPSKFRRPSKIVPNLTRLWKLLKNAEFRTPTPPRCSGKKAVKF